MANNTSDTMIDDNVDAPVDTDKDINDAIDDSPMNLVNEVKLAQCAREYLIFV